MTNREQPDTSIEAYTAKTVESKNRDYARIVSALTNIGSGHYEDISNFLQLKDPTIVSKRMKEMRLRGLIINTMVKKPTSRKKMAYVHALIENN